MVPIYFTSCKYMAGYPTTDHAETARAESVEMRAVGCCGNNLQDLSGEDVAVYACNICAAFCDESSATGKVISLF